MFIVKISENMFKYKKENGQPSSPCPEITTISQYQLPNLWAPVESENAGLFFKS